MMKNETKEFTQSFKDLGSEKDYKVKSTYQVNDKIVQYHIQLTPTWRTKIKNWIAFHNPFSRRFKTRNFKITLPTIATELPPQDVK